MKTSWLIGLIVVIIIAIGAWLVLGKQQSGTVAPSNQAGINGSSNQGNLGQTDNGQVQQPGGAQPVAGDNLVLGTSGNATVGKYLVGYTGMTLYTFDKDTGTTSSCYDTCAQNWPPYIVNSADNLEHIVAGLDDTLVGTTVRADGSLQLTYKGHPLYFYAQDTTSVDTKGDGVGGIWHIVKP